MDREQLEAWVRKSAEASGVPVHVDGPAIQRLVTLLEKGVSHELPQNMAS